MRALFIILCLLATSAYASWSPERFTGEWLRVLKNTHPIHVESDSNRLQLIQRVHVKYAAFPYKTDLENYGVLDYWATPEEMKEHKSGDCEDIAIAKYVDLRERGIPAKDMRITVTWDSHAQELHAFLVVKDGPNKWILDSQIPGRVIKAEKYYPIYEANELSERFYANGIELLKERAVASPLRWSIK